MSAALTDKRRKVDVVYIGGYGRSGSTLLDLLIGNSREVVSAGELAHVFEAWARVGKDCSCGKSVDECDFWRKVREEFELQVGGKRNVDAHAMLANQLSIESQRGFLSLLSGITSKRIQAEYRNNQNALFQALQKAGSKSLVLDSSKSARLCAGRAYALWKVGGLRVKVIHLVRDGRAVIWSVMKGSNQKMERGDRDVGLTFPLWRAMYGWLTANVFVAFQKRLLPCGSVMKVLYEDLTRNPERELTRLAEFLRIDLSEVISGLRAGHAFKGSHTISGNRLRHSGIKELSEDKEWQDRLPLHAHVFYWALCWPAHLVFRKSRS
jgi:hypothetical protein